LQKQKKRNDKLSEMKDEIMWEYYKKIDLSCFKSGLTVPKEYETWLIDNIDIILGNSKKVIFKFKDHNYDAVLNYVNRKDNPYFQFRWDNKDFMAILRKEFIYSYVMLMGNETNKNRSKIIKYYSKEVLKIRATDINIYELETFIKQETPFDNIFIRLVDEDFFGWLSSNDNDHLIVQTTEWFDISLLPLHQNVAFVIYYLIDEKNKLIYIGSANRLGDRVVPNRKEIPNWNKFRYTVIHPGYKNLLRRVENHTINAVSGFLKNNIKGILPYIISEYKLVNKNCNQ
jgi:predicted GIY-YIG superfamily endonuclease